MSLRYKKSPYTARAVVKSSLRKATVKEVCQVIKKEIQVIVSRKNGDSIFRQGPISASRPIVNEVRKKAPVLYAILKTALSRRTPAKLSRIGICASIILNSCCKHLVVPQILLSQILCFMLDIHQNRYNDLIYNGYKNY